MDKFDVVVVGAGAAGMMCAIEAGRRGRSVLVIEHVGAPGEKIRISGGGRCNFTNLHTSPRNFISANPSFCISALRRFTPTDFIGRIEREGIAWHEKTLGQLFCDGSSRQIVNMLVSDVLQSGASLRLGTAVTSVTRSVDGFTLALSKGSVACTSLVIACGGKSIPKMGATGLGYEIATQFGLRVTDTRPALVPLTLTPSQLERLAPLAGVAVNATASCRDTTFAEAVLFTHRGLSGPAILQISSFWREGFDVVVDLLPSTNLSAELRSARAENGRQALQTALSRFLPKRLAQIIADRDGPMGNLAEIPDETLRNVVGAIKAWRFKPAGTEGYRTAEVTLGGVDTRDLNSKTMEAISVPGLYFVGEVVDVTGWLGGYNFQWAWSSGWSAGQVA